MRPYLLAAAALSLLAVSTARPPVEATTAAVTVMQPQAPSPVPAAAATWRTVDLSRPGKSIIRTGAEAIARLELLSRMPTTAIPAGGLSTEFGFVIPDDVSLAAIPADNGAVVIALVHGSERTYYRVDPAGLITDEPLALALAADHDGLHMPADAAEAWTSAHEQALAWAISHARSDGSWGGVPDLSKAVAIEARPAGDGWELTIVTERSDRGSAGKTIRLGPDGTFAGLGMWSTYHGCSGCGHHRTPKLPTSIQ